MTSRTSSTSSSDQSPPRKYLILFDVEGSLAHRASSPLRKPRFDLRYKRHYIYIRPGASHFLKQLASHPSIKVGIYTSMLMHNVSPITTAILARCPGVQLYHIFDQSSNVPDPEGENEWDTMRDLNKVIQHEKCRRDAFSACNVIIVDDEIRKVRNCARNAVVSEPFTEHGIMEGLGEDMFRAMAKYFIELAEAQPADVREYLDSNPYEGDMSRAAGEDVARLEDLDETSDAYSDGDEEEVGALMDKLILGTGPATRTQHARTR
eukprot:GILK01012277.1.p1 GENE.GILK01012277.1~~GILK01012277.1.p1  ORF type:complete len:264 (-),score=36.00 GILK01012277.1:190-981(-)